MTEIEKWKYNYLNNNKSGHYTREKTLKDKYPTVYDIIINCNGNSFSEKCYCFINDIDETPKCANEGCDNKALYISAFRGYTTTCSNKCGASYGSAKGKKTMLKRYGVTHQSQIEKNILKRIE